MNEIKLQLVETGVASASVPVTWCVDKEWLKNENPNLKVCLATIPFEDGEKAEYRVVSKLSDLVTYVTFFRPGKNRIYVLIDTSKGKTGNLPVWWIDKRRGKWLEEAFKYNCSDGPELKMFYDYLIFDYIDVDLPEDVFAPEPSKWENNWVNFFFSHKATDQCDFRKRRLLAYTIQPVLIVLMFLVRWIVFLFLLGLGFRNLSKSSLINPNITTEDIWEEAKEPWVLEKTRGFWAPIGMCAVVGPMFSVILGIIGLFGGIHPLIAFLLPPAAIICITGLIFMIGMLYKTFENLSTKEETQTKEEIEYLFCPQKIVTLSDVPKKKKTYKLIFNGIKSKVCAPYRR